MLACWVQVIDNVFIDSIRFVVIVIQCSMRDCPATFVEVLLQIVRPLWHSTAVCVTDIRHDDNSVRAPVARPAHL